MVEGIPITDDTPEYQGRVTAADISPQIVEFLSSNAGSGFSESMIAEALNYTDAEGKALQQRVNGPLNKLYERIEETGEQPEGVPEGYELRRFSQPHGGRSVKTWAVVEA